MGEAKDPGLIPRICKGLFNKMNTDADKDGSASYRVEVSYLEIYNERVRDLVKTTGKDGAAHTLRVREHPKNGPYVQVSWTSLGIIYSLYFCNVSRFDI